MRIEIDTKHDTKEELAHLANMLQALAGSSQTRGCIVKPKRPKRSNIFDDPSPSAGFASMFGDNTAQPTHEVPKTSSSSGQPSSGTADLFSIFDSSDSKPSQSAASTPIITPIIGYDEEKEDEKTTTVQDLLEDNRIVPY